MKILLAPDSFKGSLSASEAAEALARGAASVCPDARILCVPVADGGEGTLDAMTLPDERKTVTVSGTNGALIPASYGIRGHLAVIEMARAAGLMLTPGDKRDVLHASTYGVGQLILDAHANGCTGVLLTVGGSGTNDGGTGLFRALGGILLDKDGNELPGDGESLCRVESIDPCGFSAALSFLTITAACDVKNPLLGPAGATAVYGPQKGASEALAPRLENGMTRWAELLRQASGQSIADIPGCGAGGGILAPCLAFGSVTIRSGIDAVLDHLAFSELLSDADLVITGEGKIDLQSCMGKAIGGVAKRCRSAGVPVMAAAGGLGEGWENIGTLGIGSVVSLTGLLPDTLSSEEKIAFSMENADSLLEEAGRKLTRLFLSQK